MKTTRSFSKIMRSTILIGMLMIGGFSLAYSQGNEGVAIGDSIKSADPSALLELFSVTKGFLPPRMTTAERDSISNPATGLLIFDTDRNRFFYYSDGWKEFSLWSKNNDDIYFHSGGVAISKDTAILTNPLVFPLTIGTDRGLCSFASGDSVPAAMGPPLSNIFRSEFTANTGYYGNVAVSTELEGSEGSAGVGITSYISNNSSLTAAISSEANYNGTGAAGLNDFLSIPLAAGMMVSSGVDNPDAIVFSAGGVVTAETDHKGYNIGMVFNASSDETYANIGLLNSINGTEEGEQGMDSLLSRFPHRVTIAALSHNNYSDSVDFNIYASGNAKNYFEGDIGIGTISPQAKLDIAGSVNASAYLLNGDTLVVDGTWSQYGNDIYYDNGNVHVGKVLHGNVADLNVGGDFFVITDTLLSFPESMFAVVKDSIASSPGIKMLVRDTSTRGGSLDTAAIGFTINAGPEGLFSGWHFSGNSLYSSISMAGLGDNDNEGIVIQSKTAEQGLAPLSTIKVLPDKFSLLVKSSDASAGAISISDGVTTLATGSASHNAGFISDSIQFQIATLGTTDTMRLVVKEQGVGINIPSPDTELHVNGNIKQKITTAGISNPPTISQIETQFGAASVRGPGWTGYLKDNDTDYFYQVVVVFNGTGYDWHAFSSTKAGN